MPSDADSSYGDSCEFCGSDLIGLNVVVGVVVVVVVVVIVVVAVVIVVAAA